MLFYKPKSNYKYEHNLINNIKKAFNQKIKNSEIVFVKKCKKVKTNNIAYNIKDTLLNKGKLYVCMCKKTCLTNLFLIFSCILNYDVTVKFN